MALTLSATLIFASAALAAEGDLGFSECLKDTGSGSSCSDAGGAVDGLDSASGVATSPDGKHVYVASFNDDAVAAFSSTPASGDVSFLEAEKDGGAIDGLDGASGVATSPDGKHVYVASFTDDAVAAFSRDAAGELDFIEAEKDGVGAVDGLDGARGVTISPDGKHVYVASETGDAVAAFDRDPITGRLDFIEAVKDGDGMVVDGLDGGRGITASPSGKQVYVVSLVDNAIATFERSPASGELTFVEAEKDGIGGVDGLDGAAGVSTSPDGKHVYVASRDDNALAAFGRSPASGELTFVEAERDGVDGVDGLDVAAGVSTSPDGKHVYVASFLDDALTAFARDPATGTLDLTQAKRDGIGGVDGLNGAHGVSISPDGKSVFVASQVDDAIAAFAREPDSTAPQTTIDSGPTGNTIDPTPSFGFSSDDPAFTASFACRIDGGPFTPCSSPATFGPLGLGPHSFEVRATDTAANTDPSPALRSFAVVKGDTKVNDPDVTLAKKLTVKGKELKVKVSAGAQEDVRVKGKGSVVAKPKKKKGGGKSKTTGLKPVTKRVEGGERTILRLKYKGPEKKRRKLSKKLARQIKRGKKARVRVQVTLTDEAGNSVTEKRVARLKVKRRRR